MNVTGADPTQGLLQGFWVGHALTCKCPKGRVCTDSQPRAVLVARDHACGRKVVGA